jgi:spore germination protein GerM
MTRSRLILLVLLGAVAAGSIGAWVSVAVRRRIAPPSTVASTPAGAATAAPGRKIKARLYYVSTDGTKLTGVDREVSYAEGATAQAQEIVSAQLTAVPAPLVSAIPAATTLRALYLDGKGAAFVDLSKDVSTAHPGGSQNELLTIYSIVNALTANLPAITSVQLLVDGKEVDTLAGHIDLRKPLQKNLGIIAP